MTEGYWTYRQFVENTVEKIAVSCAALPEIDREDYLRIQVALAIDKALRHGRSGRGDDDPVVW